MTQLGAVLTGFGIAVLLLLGLAFLAGVIMWGLPRPRRRGHR